MNALLQEFLAASVSMTALATVIAVLFWLLTGMSPWPGLVLGELAGFGFGTAMLALASPRRR